MRNLILYSTLILFLFMRCIHNDNTAQTWIGSDTIIWNELSDRPFGSLEDSLPKWATSSEKNLEYYAIDNKMDSSKTDTLIYITSSNKLSTVILYKGFWNDRVLLNEYYVEDSSFHFVEGIIVGEKVKNTKFKDSLTSLEHSNFYINNDEYYGPFAKFVFRGKVLQSAQQKPNSHLIDSSDYDKLNRRKIR